MSDEIIFNVTIFCDGACEPNPGKGGAGVVLLSGSRRKEIWQALGYTTNQRAEISANTDLWDKLDHLMQRHESVEFLWIKAHNGNKENERADALAKRGASMNGAKK